jgi:hypothetical protein
MCQSIQVLGTDAHRPHGRDYQAAPVRVTVVDIEGKVAFYAGRGPFDFRISPVQRTLRKLIAHNGYMPPTPAPQWGPPVDGLRCGISLDPPGVSIGDSVAVRLAFQNTTDEAISIYYKRADAFGRLVVGGDTEHVPRMTMSREHGRSRRHREEEKGTVRKIGPRETFETEIECNVIAASDKDAAVASQFPVAYSHELSDGMSAQIEPVAGTSLWTGTVDSGVCIVHVTPPQ